MFGGASFGSTPYGGTLMIPPVINVVASTSGGIGNTIGTDLPGVPSGIAGMPGIP